MVITPVKLMRKSGCEVYTLLLCEPLSEKTPQKQKNLKPLKHNGALCWPPELEIQPVNEDAAGSGKPLNQPSQTSSQLDPADPSWPH